MLSGIEGVKIFQSFILIKKFFEGFDFFFQKANKILFFLIIIINSLFSKEKQEFIFQQAFSIDGGY